MKLTLWGFATNLCCTWSDAFLVDAARWLAAKANMSGIYFDVFLSDPEFYNYFNIIV